VISGSNKKRPRTKGWRKWLLFKKITVIWTIDLKMCQARPCWRFCSGVRGYGPRRWLQLKIAYLFMDTKSKPCS
jgi:hypothetical protein